MRDTRLRPVICSLLLAPLVALCSTETAAQPTADAATCKLLSTTALEAALGMSIAQKSGTDSERYSSCTYSAGESASAKLEIHAPGQIGLPSSVAMGLEAANATIAEAMEGFETETFGETGCYRGKISLDEFGSLHTTSCFLPSGYIALTLGRSGEAIPMAIVKDLLEAVAAAR